MRGFSAPKPAENGAPAFLRPPDDGPEPQELLGAGLIAEGPRAVTREAWWSGPSIEGDATIEIVRTLQGLSLIRVSVTRSPGGLVFDIAKTDPGASLLRAMAWVFVEHGAVQLQLDETQQEAMSITTSLRGSWEQLKVRGTRQARTLRVYAAEERSTWYMLAPQVEGAGLVGSNLVGDTALVVGTRLAAAADELTALLSLREALAGQLRQSLLALQEAEGELARLGQRRMAVRARLEENERRVRIEASGFGAELGSAVTAAQQAMARTEQPQSSYAIVELTVHLEANIQIDQAGALELRLPAVNEQMAKGTYGSLTISIMPQLKGSAE